MFFLSFPIFLQAALGLSIFFFVLMFPFVLIPFIVSLIRNSRNQYKKYKNGDENSKGDFNVTKAVLVILGKSLLMALLGLGVLILIVVIMFWNGVE